MCHSYRRHHSCIFHSYCLVRAYLPWVRHQYLLYGSGTLILLTRVLHPHFLVVQFLHQRDILFCLVHVHRDISYKITKLSRMLFFYQFICNRFLFSKSIEFRNGKYIFKKWQRRQKLKIMYYGSQYFLVSFLVIIHHNLF